MDTALIIVDVQNDFVEGGALAVAGGRSIVPLINRLATQAESLGWMVCTTQDWHPAETPHFDKWPPHCLQFSKGADFADGLRVPPHFVQFKKGYGTRDDGYSGFEGKADYGDGMTDNTLQDVLEDNGVKHIFVVGIATDYCVQATVMDAVKLGYQVTWIENASVGVAADTTDAAIRTMAQAGVQFETATPVEG